MNIAGFALGTLIARQNNVPAPQSTTIALASGMIKSPLVGILIASAVARNLRPPPPPPPKDGGSESATGSGKGR